MNDTNELKALAAMTALNRMMRPDGYLDICTIDEIVKALGVVPERDKYQALRLLHCVRYADMPRELLQKLPGLIAECTFLADAMPQFGSGAASQTFLAHGSNVARLRIGRQAGTTQGKICKTCRRKSSPRAQSLRLHGPGTFWT